MDSLQNARGLHSDSPIGACQRFHTTSLLSTDTLILLGLLAQKAQLVLQPGLIVQLSLPPIPTQNWQPYELHRK